MIHAVVRTDNMASTDVRGGEDLVSAKYYNNSAAAAIDNGNVVLISDLEADASGEREREVYTAGNVAANSNIKDVVLVTTPELFYDERQHNLDEYQNEAGKIIRGTHFHRNDTFAVTKEALDGVATPAVNNIVELKAGTKLNVAASLTSGSTKVGHIIRVENTGRYTYYVIKVD